MKRALGLFLGLIIVIIPFVTAWAVDANYVLNPGDVMQVTVWKEDGLDREVLVLPDGTFSFPLIGTVTANGRTAADVQKEITTRISKFIPDASVTVAVKAALGNVIDVIGQVNKPGELVVGHQTTVMQALSMAGGLTPYASESRIRILRHSPDGKETSIRFPYDDVAGGDALDKDIVLHAGDVVVVPNASIF